MSQQLDFYRKDLGKDIKELKYDIETLKRITIDKAKIS